MSAIVNYASRKATKPSSHPHSFLCPMYRLCLNHRCRRAEHHDEGNGAAAAAVLNARVKTLLKQMVPQIPAQAQPQMAAAMGAELSAKLQAILSAA